MLQPDVLRAHFESKKTVQFQGLNVVGRLGDKHVWLALTTSQAVLRDPMICLPMDGHITLVYVPLELCSMQEHLERVLGVARGFLASYKSEAFQGKLLVSEAYASDYGIWDILVTERVYHTLWQIVHRIDRQCFSGRLRAGLRWKSGFHLSVAPPWTPAAAAGESAVAAGKSAAVGDIAPAVPRNVAS